MVCKELLFSDHAVTQMFERSISVTDVEYIISSGEIIISYADDKPFPSYLIFNTINNRPLHVLVGKEPLSEKCIVVTTYQPDISLWNNDFKSRKI